MSENLENFFELHDKSLEILETSIPNNFDQNSDEYSHSTKVSYNITNEYLEKKRKRKKKRKKRICLNEDEKIIDLMQIKEKIEKC